MNDLRGRIGQLLLLVGATLHGNKAQPRCLALPAAGGVWYLGCEY